MIMKYDQNTKEEKPHAVKHYLVDFRSAFLMQDLLTATKSKSMDTWGYKFPSHEEGFNAFELCQFYYFMNKSFGDEVVNQKQVRAMVDSIFEEFKEV